MWENQLAARHWREIRSFGCNHAVGAAQLRHGTHDRQHDGRERDRQRKLAEERSRKHEIEKQVLEFSVDEQRRIGQELHDSAGQELTGLGLMASALIQSLETKAGLGPTYMPLEKSGAKLIRLEA